MKPIISLVTLLLLSACAEEHSNPKKYQFTFPAGGLYFYNVNNKPVSTTKCVVVSK